MPITARPGLVPVPCHEWLRRHQDARSAHWRRSGPRSPYGRPLVAPRHL